MPSTVTFGSHPVHLMLNPFPRAFFVAALASDLTYLVLHDAYWVKASFWLLLSAVVLGVLAAAVGLIDFATIRQARAQRAGWVHAFGNAFVLALAALNLWLRRDGVTSPWSLGLTVATVVLLGVTDWHGAELLHTFGIGVGAKRNS